MTVATDHLFDAPELASDLMKEAMHLHSWMPEALDDDPELVSRVFRRLAWRMSAHFLIHAADATDKSLEVIWLNAECLATDLEPTIGEAFAARVGRMPIREECEWIVAAILKGSGLYEEWVEAEGRFLQRFEETSIETLFPYIDKVAVPRR